MVLAEELEMNLLNRALEIAANSIPNPFDGSKEDDSDQPLSNALPRDWDAISHVSAEDADMMMVYARLAMERTSSGSSDPRP